MKKVGLVVALMVLLLVAVFAATRLGSGEPAAEQRSIPQSVLTDPCQNPDAVAASGIDSCQKSDQTPASGTPTPDETLTVTDSPDAYAQAVAAVVFGLDTRELDAADYSAAFLADADPTLTATGRADLERLIAERIPAADMWQRMRANQQWSTFEASSVWEPGSWEQVVTSGQAEPGWAMRNVTGIQTTHYVEAGAAKVASRERTVTVGIRCPAPGTDVDRCHLVLIGATVVP